MLQSNIGHNQEKKTASERFWWTAKMLAIGGLSAGGLYLGWQAILPILAAGAQARSRQTNTLQPSAKKSSPGVCLPPLVQVETLNQNPLLANAAPAISMRNITTGASVTIWPEVSSSTAVLTSAGHDNLNFQIQGNTPISRLAASTSQATIVPNSVGYSAAWTDTVGTTQGVCYNFLNAAGALANPLSIESAGNTVTQNTDTNPTIVALANEYDLSMVFASEFFNAVIQPSGANDYQLNFRSVVNGVAQGTESSFTNPTANTGLTDVVNWNYFAQPALIINNGVQTVFCAYVYMPNAATGGASQVPPPSAFTEIRYITSPATATKAQGTSITATHFGTTNYQFANPSAFVFPNNAGVATAYLAKLKTGPANTYNVYIQLLSSALALNGNPIALPFTVTGNAKPVLVKTPYGFGIFISNGTTTNPQAYFMGFNNAGTVVQNLVQLSPSTNPQLFATGAVANNGNILARWQENINNALCIRSTVRTPTMEIALPSTPWVYTENTPVNLGFGLTSPINLPSGTTTIVTVSIPTGSGSLSISNTLPGSGTAVFNADNTQLTFQTTSASIINSITEMNLNLGCIEYTPALNSNATVAVTLNAQLGNAAPVNTTVNMPGISVNYLSQWVTPPSFDVEQGATVNITTTNFNATDVGMQNLIFTVSNVQHGSFISVPDSNLPMNYPGTVVTTFTTNDLNNGLIRFHHDNGIVAPTFNVAITGAGGLTTTPIAGQVDFYLDPLPINEPTSPIVINQGETFVFSGAYLNTTDIGWQASDLTYSILGVSQHLTFQYRDTTNSSWVSFPDPQHIQFTQDQINNGLISALQDGTTFNTAFSYEVTNPLGLSSPAKNANVIFNPTPVWISSTIIYNQLNITQTITPSQISVQDSGPATQLELMIVEAGNCTVFYDNEPLAVGDSFFQSDVNTGHIRSSVQGEAPSLKLNAKDQYGAQAMQSIDTLYLPQKITNNNNNNTTTHITKEVGGSSKNSLPTILGTTISGASLVLGTAWKAREIYKQRQKSLRICAFGYLLSQELGLTGLNDFDGADGIQYVEAVNAIAAQLAGQGITYSALPHDNQKLLAKTLAEYFKSSEGKKYILHERSLESLKSQQMLCFAYMTKCSDMISSPKLLDHNSVKNNAYLIAGNVSTLYRDALKHKNGVHVDEVEMKRLEMSV